MSFHSCALLSTLRCDSSDKTYSVTTMQSKEKQPAGLVMIASIKEWFVGLKKHNFEHVRAMNDLTSSFSSSKKDFFPFLMEKTRKGKFLDDSDPTISHLCISQSTRIYTAL